MARRDEAGGEGGRTEVETAVLGSVSAGGAAAVAGVSETGAWGGMTREQLVEFYRMMYLSRRTDDREIVLKRQQKIFFQISCAGHEALLVAAGMAMRAGYYWFFPYYRDRALCLTLGSTVEEQLLQAVGAAEDVASGGRQMPSHWSNKKLHIVTPSSAVATQCLHAIGCAEAGRYFSRHTEAAKKPAGDYREGDYRSYKDVTFHGDEVTYVSIGEGSTSQGEFWESLNTASNGRLAVVYVVEDNEYAISTPVEANTPGGNISRLIANFPNFHFAEVDGTDPIACYAAMVEAVEYCRSGRGPALVHGHVTRPYSHSLSDDERQYRSEEEVTEENARDPLAKMQLWLLREGILDEAEINRLEQKVDEEVQRAADRAMQAVLPSVALEAILRHQYSEDLKPTDARFDTEPEATADASERTMAELLNHCLKDEMRRDERIVVFGEDVADATRDSALRAGKIKARAASSS